ncbi:sensor domain-containing diguanylate cyclase [Xanthobacter sediminis]
MPDHFRLSRFARYLTLVGFLVALLIATIAASTLWQSRQDTWDLARREADNLRKGVIGYVEQRLRIYQQSLDLAVHVLSAPEFEGLSAEVKRTALQTIARGTDYIGGIVQLDADGRPVASSFPLPEGVNFADRTYFTVPRDDPKAGVYVSRPFVSRLRSDWIIALSHRLSNPDGSFAGVAVIAVRLAFIEAFLGDIDMGRHGAILLLGTDGTVLARQPPTAGLGGIGTDLSQTPVFKRIREMGSGSFVAAGAVDDVERLYTFAQVPHQPLIVNVAPAIRDIFAAWWWRAIVSSVLTLATCALVVLLTVLLRRELRHRTQIESELYRLSLTDALTGLPNRRRYEEVIQREWRRTRRTGSPLALLLLDADDFKKLNDRYGHAVGDEVLKVLARTVESCIRRPGDLAARYGGEEFAVVLPDTACDGALHIAERIRAACEALDVGLPRFTVSIGVKAALPSSEQSVEEFQEETDKALYRAKNEGRNRVVAAG